MEEIGMKISKEGEDALKTGVKNLLLDTRYPLLKIKASGTGSLSMSDGDDGDEDVIAHNLGYIPKVLVYGQYYDIYAGGKSDAYLRFPMRQQMVTYYSYFSYEIDENNLTVVGAFMDDSSYSGTFSYFYYLFYDEA